MKINEMEELLGVSKANIRFYEKEGLLNPKRLANGYRDYGEEEVTQLKKIIILRKLGMAIPQIRDVFNGEVGLQDALEHNRMELERQLAELNGAINLCKTMEQDEQVTTDFDENYYWNLMQDKEAQGDKFAELVSDYMEMQKKSLLSMWEKSFLFPLGKTVNKSGWRKAFLLILLICVLRGIGRELFGTGSFLGGFLYPFVLFGIVSLITLPLFLLNQKYKNVELEEEVKPKTDSKPGVRAAIEFIMLLLYFFVVLFGGVIWGSDFIIHHFVDNAFFENQAYIMTSKLVVLYFMVALYLLVVSFWMYGQMGIFGSASDKDTGFKAHLPKKVKTKVLAVSIVLYLVALYSCSVCFDCVTQTGVQRRIFFYTKEYTWQDLKTYRISASWDGTLNYTLVMKDGKEVVCLGAGFSGSEMPEDIYPNADEDFCLALTRTFKQMGIAPEHWDYDKVRKKLDYEYWQEYLEELRVAMEE